MPMSSVLRSIRFIRLKNMAQSITKARQKRTESMFSGLMVVRSALDSSREVLRATITPARRNSAGFTRQPILALALMLSIVSVLS